MAIFSVSLFVWTSVIVVGVQSQSMSPALEHGDKVIVLRRWPARWLRKGQIVLVWPWLRPSDDPQAWSPPNAVPFIKRVAGLPGETLVTILTDLSDVDIHDALAEHDSEGKRVWHIPAGHIFVQSDNRPSGSDSLTWGPIHFRSVLGLAIIKLPAKGGATICGNWGGKVERSVQRTDNKEYS
jgi:signal peptidase I